VVIEGRCHCGNIAFTFDWGGDPAAIPARVCGCDFCTKHGGVWTSHPRSRLEVRERDPAAVSRYLFGTRTADFHVCRVCGAVPLVTCELEGVTYAVVNVNTFENVDRSAIRKTPADFEGEAQEARLERRKRNWIGDVRFARS
jgi:hypothetical protein